MVDTLARTGLSEEILHVVRYPLSSLIGDYIRSAAGVAIGLGVLIAVAPSPAILAVFGSILLLFSVFGLRTIERQILQVAVSDHEICWRGFRRKTLAWSDLEQLKLRFYGTRRQRRNEGTGGSEGGGGFLQLTLKGAGTRIAFESSVQGFEMIAWRAAKAMRDNKFSLDPTSAGNLLAIGVDADGETPPEVVLGQQEA